MLSYCMRQNLIIDGFRRKVFFGDNDVSHDYKDLMVSNLHGKDQSESHPDTTNMPDLDCNESAAQRNNQSGKGLKTPNQMLSRLLVTLA